MSKIFLDTNILIYGMDRYDPRKQKACRALLNSLETDHSGVISTQVMQKFFVAGVKKLQESTLYCSRTFSARLSISKS